MATASAVFLKPLLTITYIKSGQTVSVRIEGIVVELGELLSNAVDVRHGCKLLLITELQEKILAFLHWLR